MVGLDERQFPAEAKIKESVFSERMSYGKAQHL